MDKIIVSQTSDIKSLILTVRDTQVLLDSDVAMLYGYETKNINLAATRNKDRFPENFRFRLTREEYESVERLRLQNETSNTNLASRSLRLQNETLNEGRGAHRKYLPHVYTEQGIAMLSGILKNKVAVQVSIGIMNAFVEMRRFIAAYGKTFERLTTVEYKLLEHDRKFDDLFNLIQPPELPQQGIFFKGEIYDAFSLVVKIIGEARKTLVIIDNYADDTIFDMLAKRKREVTAVIITASPGRITQTGLDKINAQYPTVSVVKCAEFHDRFIIVDSNKVYHVGASLKDAGKKCFALALLDDDGSIVARAQSVIGT